MSKSRSRTDLQVNKIHDDDRSLPVFAEMDQLMERIRERAYRMFARRGFGDGHAMSDWLAAEREYCWPAAELRDEGEHFAISIALAGFEPDEIDVTATPHELIVKARHEVSAEAQETEGKTRRSEFASRDVYRRIEFPTAVDVESIEPHYRNGMLELTATKRTGADDETRRIEVSSAA